MNGLNSQFTVETQQNFEELQMKKYIEEKLKEKQGLSKVNNSEQNKEEETSLSTSKPIEKKENNIFAHSIPSASSIPEIQLPIEYKLKNIAETEKARQLLSLENQLEQEEYLLEKLQKEEEEEQRQLRRQQQYEELKK